MSLTVARPIARPSATASALPRFFILVFGWSWLLWGLLAITGLPPLATPGIFLLVLGGFGPSLAAVAIVIWSGSPGERASFWVRLVSPRRIPLRWAVVILTLPLALTMLALVADRILGGVPSDLIDIAAATLARPGALAALVAQMLIGGALAEELGWRGYALDRLVIRWSPLVASLLLGAIWALWHVPLFFVRGTAQGEMGVLSSGFGLFCLTIIAQSILFTWIYQHTGRSILAAVALHFMIDFSLTLFTGLGHAQAPSALAWRTAVYTLAAAAVVLGSWPAWTQLGQETD